MSVPTGVSRRGLVRQQRILDAAAHLFGEHGYAAVGVDLIGRRAGMTGPGIYRHFAGKDEILATLLERAFDGVVSATGGSFEDPWQELEHIAHGHARFLLDERRVASVWVFDQRSLADPYRRRLRNRQLGYVERLRHCISRCIPDASDAEARSVTDAVLGVLNSVVGWARASAGHERALVGITADLAVEVARRWPATRMKLTIVSYPATIAQENIRGRNEMTIKMTQAELGVLDPETYANGNPDTFGLPLDAYRYLREHEPVCLHTFEEDPLLLDRLYVVSRHADIVAVDRDPDTFAANRGPVNFWAFVPIGAAMDAPAMLTQDGEEHRTTRRIVSKGFTPKVLQDLEGKFRRYAVEIVEKALEIDGPFNFIDEIAHVMPMQALGDVLGVPEEDRAKFFHWVDQFAAPFDTRITPSFEEVGKAIFELYQYAAELEDLRRREPGENVMTKLAEAGLPAGEIRGNVALLASGAAESTRTALGHGLHELLRRPEQMQWLRENADDIPMTAPQEMVRIASPFTHLCRTVTKDTELSGTELHEGDIVAMLFASGNFDPEAIEDPEDFNLARNPNPHVSFGKGPHSCLGKHVAALEIKILLEELLQRTKEIRPAGPISYVRDAYSRGVYELPIELVKA